MNTKIIQYVINYLGFKSQIISHSERSVVMRTIDKENKETIFKVRPKTDILLIKESELLKKVSHQNIVTVLDIFECNDYLFLQMEKACGQCLVDILSKESLLTEDESRLIFGQVIETLVYLLSCGYVHLDLKPDNIIFDRESGKVTMIDFEFCSKLNDCESNTSRKKFNQALGTWKYMSPEVQRGEFIGPEADVWALGVSLYASITGFYPRFEIPSKEFSDSIIVNEYQLPQKTNQLLFPFPLSKNIEDLLKSMLDENINTRAKLSEIQQHPWFLNYDSLYLKKSLSW